VSLLPLKHAKFLQSALSLFGGLFPCKLSNIAAFIELIIGAFFHAKAKAIGSITLTYFRPFISTSVNFDFQAGLNTIIARIKFSIPMSITRYYE